MSRAPRCPTGRTPAPGSHDAIAPVCPIDGSAEADHHGRRPLAPAPQLNCDRGREPSAEELTPSREGSFFSAIRRAACVQNLPSRSFHRVSVKWATVLAIGPYIGFGLRCGRCRLLRYSKLGAHSRTWCCAEPNANAALPLIANVKSEQLSLTRSNATSVTVIDIGRA